MELARLVLRQDAGSETEATPTCEGSNEYDGRMGVRISSIFVILVGSTWGKSLPFALHHVPRRLPLSVYITSVLCNLTCLQLYLSALRNLLASQLYTSH